MATPTRIGTKRLKTPFGKIGRACRRHLRQAVSPQHPVKHKRKRRRSSSDKCESTRSGHDLACTCAPGRNPAPGWIYGTNTRGRARAYEFGIFVYVQGTRHPKVGAPLHASLGCFEANTRRRARTPMTSDNVMATRGKRVPCGGRRHRDGKPCEALSEPGKRRCRFHGGRSTGPRTEAGKARSLANLRQNR